MSNTGNQPPGGTQPGDDDAPPSSQSGADAKPASTSTPTADASQTPPASSPAADSSPSPASAPPPSSTPPDSAPASAPTSAAGSSPPVSDGSPPSSQAPDSKPPDSDGCAEIPTAAHAVLTAEIKLAVQLPYPMDQVTQLPHKLTLTNDDGSYSKVLTLASDCTAGSTDGTSLITFTDLTDGHAYTLQCDDGTETNSMFEKVPYDQLVQQLGAADTGDTADAPPASVPGDESYSNDDALGAGGAA